ncbi:hypothetical protein VNO80_13440 [Phaseolus coccineus]|uniref:Uncharacterized protein n=1 Tax=Phaseolus coccineus TaxID=3886 RepID=A0AAN9RB94_PHACN
MERNSTSAFEFPSLQSDVVFGGKLTGCQTHPSSEHQLMARSNPYRKLKLVRCVDHAQRRCSLQLPETGYSRFQRRNTCSKKYASRLFGVVKFPLQMKLSDIKRRQSERSARLAAAARDGEQEKGEKSGLEWRLIRTLRRKSAQWLNALSTSSFDFFGHINILRLQNCFKKKS